MSDEQKPIASDLWLLPDGVEEMLPPDSGRVEELRRQLLDLYGRWAYQLVFPPLIEYLESLLTGVGSDLELQTFKITDQASGKMMGIRADMTPQLARIDARRYQQGAHRVCYVGTVLRTRSNPLMPSRAPVQTGCELFGISATEADVEVISIMLETLELAGISDICLNLSHVDICQFIIRKAQLSTQTRQRLLSALQRKSEPEIRQLAGEIKHEDIRRYLLALPGLAGSPDILSSARTLFNREPELLAAVGVLADVVNVIGERYPQINIFIDLCDLRGFKYHTGLLFAAYTAGIGQAVAQGGRYDGVGAEFGNARPATGFSADLKVLLRMSGVRVEQQYDAILAPPVNDPELWKFVSELRKTQQVITCMPGEEDMDRRGECDRVVVKDDQGKWAVKPYR